MLVDKCMFLNPELVLISSLNSYWYQSLCNFYTPNQVRNDIDQNDASNHVNACSHSPSFGSGKLDR